MNPQKAVLPLLAAVAAWAALIPPAAGSGPSYEALFPCFRDIAGWEAGSPDGMALEVSGMKMVSATRTYTQGERSLDVMLMTGPEAMGAWLLYDEGFRLETPEERIEVSTMEGYPVQRTEEKREDTASVTVMLGREDEKTGGALLSFSATGVPSAELLTIARSFDWKCFKEKAASVR